MRSSFTKKYLFLSLLFGIAMGLVFPLYALLFVEFKSETHEFYFNAGCVLAGITVGLASYFIGRATIIKNIRALSEKMQALMSGEQTHTENLPLDSADEIGQIARDFVKFNDGITNAMHQIKKLSEEYNQLSSVLSHNSRQLVSECGNALQNMQHLQSETGKLDTKTAENTAKTATVADVIKETDALSNETQRNIAETADAFKAIQEIVDALSDIVSETKILSLNASVESSHAGEFGKGFSVLAKEIKRQSEAMHLFAQKIADVSNMNMAKSEKARGLSEINAKKSDDSVAIFEQLRQNFAEQTAISTHISHSLEQYSTKFHSLQHVSKNMDEVASHIEELTKSFEQLLRF